ncbi:hypothetical protein JCM10207_007235 [Rhodosporidiobolus poonsookiae]
MASASNKFQGVFATGSTSGSTPDAPSSNTRSHQGRGSTSEASDTSPTTSRAGMKRTVSAVSTAEGDDVLIVDDEDDAIHLLEADGVDGGVHVHGHPAVTNSRKHAKRASLLTAEELKKAEHDHRHLAAVTHETRHHHHIEEVERSREVDRHVHHVQHHVQPLLDTQTTPEKKTRKDIGLTEIREAHVGTDADRAQFAALKVGRDTIGEVDHKATVIDHGEKVRERVHNHVHHLVQPEIVREIHDTERQITYIPTHVVTHEAPVIHTSTVLKPMRIDQYVQSGGTLTSNLQHNYHLLDSLHPAASSSTSSVAGETCARVVRGPGEEYVERLGLSRYKVRDASPFERAEIHRSATPV